MVRDLSEHPGLSCRKPSFGASSSASLRGWARSTEFPRHWCVRQWHRITGGFRVSERDTMERCTQRADPVVIRVASNPEKYNGMRLPLPRGGHVLLGCPRRVDTVRSYPLRVSALVRKRDTRFMSGFKLRFHAPQHCPRNRASRSRSKIEKCW